MKSSFKQYSFYILILALGILFYCYEYFLRISPSVVMGELMHHFSVDALGLTKILVVYYLAYALGQIPAGLLLDRFPLKLVLAASAFLCSIATFVFAATHSAPAAEAARFAVGFVSSFAFVGALKIGEVYLPSSYFTRVVGVTVALGTIMASYGNVLLAYLARSETWSYLFHGVALIGIFISFLFVLAYFIFPNKSPKPENNAYTLKDIKQLIKSKFLWINAIIGGLFYLPSAIITDVWGNAFLHATYHLNFVETSSILSFLFIGWMVGSPFMGTLADFLKNPWMIMAGGAFLTLLVLASLFGGSNFVAGHLELMLFAFGFFGSSQLVVWKIFHQHSTMTLAATGIALTNMIITLTVTAGQFMMGFVLNHFSQADQLSAYSASDFHHALLWLSLPLILVIILQVLVRKK